MKKTIAIILSIILVLGITFSSAAVSTIAVKNIKLDNSKITLKAGQTSNLKVTFTPENTYQKSLTYVTGNKKIATVDAYGKITGVGAGTTTITVYTTNKKIFAKCNVTILQPSKADLSQGQPLEYSYFSWEINPPKCFDDNPKDVVTPYIEKKFNIKVKSTMYTQGTSFKDKITQFVATNDFPDVICAMASDASTIVKTGQYAELGSLIKENMPNLIKLVPADQWKEALYQGKMYCLPYNIPVDGANPKYANDPFTLPASTWNLVIREDILQKLGYKFTPLAQIQKKANAEGRKLTLDDLKIEPKIATPEDFYEFLKKVKALNIKVGDNALIPLTIPWFFQMHLGNMFNWVGGWGYYPDKNDVAMHLGSPHAKEYYQFLNKLYREDLIDRDFLIQKENQIQEKFASGRVASGMWAPDFDGINSALTKLASTTLRPVEMPIIKNEPRIGIDHYAPIGQALYIKKDFKDIPRLLKYFDWFLSDEGFDISTWGPESDGLWEIKAGKKVFKDPEMFQAYKTGEPKAKDPSLFGLGYFKNSSYPISKAVGCALIVNSSANPKSIERSYPYQVTNVFTAASATIGALNLDKKMHMLNPIDSLTSAANDYTWGEFFPKDAAKLVAAKTDEEFEKNWNDIYKQFVTKAKYDEAKKDMLKHYKEIGIAK